MLAAGGLAPPLGAEEAVPQGSRAAISLRPGSRAAILPPAVPPPAYYRPVVVDGKSFPLARSNFLSLLVIHPNWHAPRMRVVDGVWRLVGIHEGIDIAAEPGTPILSMTGGVVEAVGWSFYSGMRVGVRGRDGRYYFYAHLSSVAPELFQGATVEPGQVLGRVGNTGYGPPGHRDEFPAHLHFGIEEGDEWINPYPLLVALYRAAVSQHARWQAGLDELARAGDAAGWQEAAAGSYAGVDVAGWE